MQQVDRMVLNGASRLRKKRIFQGVLLVFLIAAMGYRAYVIFRMFIPYGMDSDVATDIVYLRQTFLEKNLFPEGFIHCNDTLLNRSWLPYWLFYAVTNDFIRAYQFTSVFMLIVQLLAVYYLMRCVGLRKETALFSLCMYVVWMPKGINYVIVYPSNVNSPLVVIAVLTLALKIKLDYAAQRRSKLGKRTAVLYSLLLLAMSAWSGYTTAKLVIILYVPLVMVDACRIFLRYKTKHRLDQQYVFSFAGSLVLLFVNLLGYKLLLLFHGNAFVQRGAFMRGTDAWFEWDAISQNIKTFLEFLGVTGAEGSLASWQGLSLLIYICFFALIILSIAQLLSGAFSRAISDNSTEDEMKWLAVDEVVWTSLASTAVIAAYMFATGVYATRYYVIASAFLPAICGAAMEKWSWDEARGQDYLLLSFVTIGLAALLSVNAHIDRNIRSSPTPPLMSVAEYIEQEGYKYVTATFWKAAVITGLTDGEVDYQHITISDDGNEILKEHKWLIDERKYEEKKEGVPNILLLTDEEESIVLGRSAGAKLLSAGSKINEISEYNLYEYVENPFILQKELQRMYILGETVSFDGTDQDAHRFFESGISDAEGNFAWTDGDTARMLADLGSAVESDLVLQLDLAAIYQAPQRMTVRSGEAVLFDESIADVSSPVNIVIPAACVEDQTVELIFEFPDAVSPKERGESGDARELAFAIRSFCLKDEE